MRIETRMLEGNDPAQTLIDFARNNQITQIFLARTGKRTYLMFSPTSATGGQKQQNLG
jgi:K+-sensing histidine kinase KdpD